MGLFEAFKKVSYQDWLEQITTDLKGKDYEETLVWNSGENINVQPFYNSSSVTASFTPLREGSSWKIKERIVIDSIQKANQRAIQALKGGANAILFDGEIDTQKEMDELLSGIQTDIIDVHFYNPSPYQTINLITPNSGSISYDYLGAYMISGKWVNSKEKDIEALAKITKAEQDFKTITINGNYYGNNGYSIIQEIAFSLSQAVEYLNLLTDQKIEAKNIASKIQFNYSVGSNYFFEIAKLRAVRKLWELVLTQYEVNDTAMTIHSETSVSASNEDNNYNILRNTTRAMSAIIGGCDSLTVLPHDNNAENINFSSRIARNIQHILKEEAFFDKVKNPADGAYYIEQLTEELSTRAWDLFKEVEAQGGFLACTDNNFIKGELRSSVNA